MALDVGLGLKCPINLNPLSSPILAPCGHTFNYSPDSYRALQKVCPLDRKELSFASVKMNTAVMDLFIKTRSMMRIFLGGHPQAPVLKERCALSGKILENPVVLPCFVEHEAIVDQETINELSQSNVEGKIVCPLCDQTFERSDTFSGIGWIDATREKYPDFVKQVKEFNAALNRRVEVEDLDDRIAVKKLLTCCFSQEIFQDPLHAKCGHVFDRKAFDGRNRCPINAEVLKEEEATLDFVLKGAAAEFSSTLYQGREQISGVWIYLENDAKCARIEEIAKKLGFCRSDSCVKLVAPLGHRWGEEPWIYDSKDEIFNYLIDETPLICVQEGTGNIK